METKRIPLDSLELKFANQNMVFSGYASVFGGVDAYGDTIDPQAYKSTLANRSRPVRMRWNHYGPVIGKWIEMYSDEKGLYVEGELTPGHSVASDVYASMKHGAIDGMSIGYIPVKSQPLDGDKRLLKEIELIEISIVEEPADLGAKINDVKAAIDECHSLKEIEALLREAGGFSRADALSLVGRVKRLALGEQDAELKAKQEIAKLFQITL
jgi:uncharacterized protein